MVQASLIDFVLNAQINSVRTPDMLKLWGYIDSAACVLGSVPKCTLHHILVNCTLALDQGRYTWRHDSVLQKIERVMLVMVPVFNNKKSQDVLLRSQRKTSRRVLYEQVNEKKANNTSQKRCCLLDHNPTGKGQTRSLVLDHMNCNSA